MIDVSLTGLRISTDLDIAPDTPLMLRVTLPKDTGRLEVLVKVARRDSRGFGVSFLTLGEGEAERIAPFVAPGDIRRWARRVAVSLPIRIETGAEEGDVLHGRTIDLSTSGGRLSVGSPLTAGDVVIVPTTSTSFINGTGLKKCIPMNRSTRFVAVIISVITSDDVLLAKIAAGLTILSITA